jgi:hypothetical protein
MFGVIKSAFQSGDSLGRLGTCEGSDVEAAGFSATARVACLAGLEALPGDATGAWSGALKLR